MGDAVVIDIEKGRYGLVYGTVRGRRDIFCAAPTTAELVEDIFRCLATLDKIKGRSSPQDETEEHHVP